MYVFLCACLSHVGLRQNIEIQGYFKTGGHIRFSCGGMFYRSHFVSGYHNMFFTPFLFYMMLSFSK